MAGTSTTSSISTDATGLIPGGLVKFRAESRYGELVNGISGQILPVNTTALFPVTNRLDEDVAIAITDLNYTQFLSEHLAVFFGKLDTLDADSTSSPPVAARASS